MSTWAALCMAASTSRVILWPTNRAFGDLQLQEHILLHHDDVKAVNTEDNPGNVAPGSGPGGILENGKAQIRVPALSRNVLRFNRRELTYFKAGNQQEILARLPG